MNLNRIGLNLLLILGFSCNGYAQNAWSSSDAESLVPEQDAISDFVAQRTLVEVLTNNPDLSNQNLEHLLFLLRQRPLDTKSRLLLVRVYLQQKEYTKATDQILRLHALQLENPTSLSELAQLEADLGHYQEAQRLYERAIALDDDPHLLLKYAGLMQLWGDYERAQGIYRSYLDEYPYEQRIDLYLATAIAGEERFIEAEQIYLNMLCNNQTTDEALLGMARAKFEQRDYCSVVEYLSGVQKPTAESIVLAASALDKVGEPREAIALLQEFVFKANNDSVVAATLLVKAHRIALHACELDLAMHLLEMASEQAPYLIPVQYHKAIACESINDLLDSIYSQTRSAQELVEWAYLFFEDNYIDIAIELFRNALEIDPFHDAARIALAGALSSQMHYAEAADIYLDLQDDFIHSSRFPLQYARVLSWAKCYQQALYAYEQYIQCHPDNPIAHIERARVALWWQKGDLAMCYYRELLADHVDPLVQQAVALEMRTEWARWNNLPFTALDSYETWIAYHPGNPQALFGYSELLCELGACQQANCVRAAILEDDPKNQIVEMALDRQYVLNQPTAISVYDYWHEVGYGVLSGIWRHKVQLGLEVPLCCNSKVRLLYDHFLDHTLIEHHDFEAEAVTLEYENILSPYLAIYGSLTQKLAGNYNIHNPTQGLLKIQGRASDNIRYGLGVALKDEYYDYFGVLQGVQSTSLWANGSLQIDRRQLLEGRLERRQYTDHNHQSIFQLGYTLQLSEAPTTWKAFVQTEYRNTDQTNSFIYSDDDTLIDIIHPYWAPQRYWAGRAGLEVMHDLQTIAFCGARKHYYVLRGSVYEDTEDNPGGSFNFEYHWDYSDIWSLYLSGAVYRSRLWNAEGIWSGCSYRF
jgi:tetratricopeptide (TPR) repeat protein